eukprot:3002887-Pyramimonas_sp.AAC.1
MPAGVGARIPAPSKLAECPPNSLFHLLLIWHLPPYPRHARALKKNTTGVCFHIFRPFGVLARPQDRQVPTHSGRKAGPGDG